jgi:hypothetical protein
MTRKRVLKLPVIVNAHAGLAGGLPVTTQATASGNHSQPICDGRNSYTCRRPEPPLEFPQISDRS